MATKRVHRWLDYITNERPSHRTSVLVSIVHDVTQRGCSSLTIRSHICSPLSSSQLGISARFMSNRSTSTWLTHVPRLLAPRLHTRQRSPLLSAKLVPPVLISQCEMCSSNGARVRSAPEQPGTAHSKQPPNCQISVLRNLLVPKSGSLEARMATSEN